MTAPIDNASFYADPAALNALRRDAKTQSKESLRAAAQQFESLFTQMMLKSMREASFGDSLTGSQEMDFYQGMFDEQLSAHLSKGKGLGLADMLVEQLTRSGVIRQPGGDSDAAGTKSPDATHHAQPTTVVGEAAGLGTRPIVPASGSTTSAVWPPASREAFVKQLWPHAEKAGERLGVAPSTLIAHAALETGWGRSMPVNADGSASFNLFGIKATAQWNGATTQSRTTEFENRSAVSRVERFKSYESPAECFEDYANLLGGAARYAGARDTGADAQRFAKALQQGGYATDPEYAKKLSATAAGLASTLARGSNAVTLDSSYAALGRNNGGDAA